MVEFKFTAQRLNGQSINGTLSAISVSEAKKKVRQVELIQTFLFELEKIYELFNKGKTQKIISDWTERSSTIGKNVEMNSTKGKIIGKAIRIEEDGGLIVSKGNGKTNKIVAGDIIHN